MKLKVKVKLHDGGKLPQVIKKGDWIDLTTSENVSMRQWEYRNICLGVSMELPKGFEAVVVPRSSTFKKHGVLQTNSFGVIDNSFNSDFDIWHFPAFSMRETSIPEGTRICQFKVQLSQFATPWQKIKWLLTRSVEFESVYTLGHEKRGGFGSTGN